MNDSQINQNSNDYGENNAKNNDNQSNDSLLKAKSSESFNIACFQYSLINNNENSLVNQSSTTKWLTDAENFKSNDDDQQQYTNNVNLKLSENGLSYENKNEENCNNTNNNNINEAFLSITNTMTCELSSTSYNIDQNNTNTNDTCDTVTKSESNTSSLADNLAEFAQQNYFRSSRHSNSSTNSNLHYTHDCQASCFQIMNISNNEKCYVKNNYNTNMRVDRNNLCSYDNNTFISANGTQMRGQLKKQNYFYNEPKYSFYKTADNGLSHHYDQNFNNNNFYDVYDQKLMKSYQQIDSNQAMMYMKLDQNKNSSPIDQFDMQDTTTNNSTPDTINIGFNRSSQEVTQSNHGYFFPLQHSNTKPLYNHMTNYTIPFNEHQKLNSKLNYMHQQHGTLLPPFTESIYNNQDLISTENGSASGEKLMYLQNQNSNLPLKNKFIFQTNSQSQTDDINLVNRLSIKRKPSVKGLKNGKKSKKLFDIERNINDNNTNPNELPLKKKRGRPLKNAKNTEIKSLNNNYNTGINKITTIPISNNINMSRFTHTTTILNNPEHQQLQQQQQQEYFNDFYKQQNILNDFDFTCITNSSANSTLIYNNNSSNNNQINNNNNYSQLENEFHIASNENKSINLSEISLNNSTINQQQQAEQLNDECDPLADAVVRSLIQPAKGEVNLN